MLHLVLLPVVALHLVLFQLSACLHVSIIITLARHTMVTQFHNFYLHVSPTTYPIVLQLILVQVDDIGTDSIHKVLGM